MTGPSSSRRTSDNNVSRIRKKTREVTDDNRSTQSDADEHERVGQVRKEWEHRNFYIPGELDDSLDAARDDMADAIETEFGGSMAVTRHFYPVMIQLGLERIQQLTATEFAERVDRIPGVSSNEFSGK